jgi:hypothetical protein
VLTGQAGKLAELIARFQVDGDKKTALRLPSPGVAPKLAVAGSSVKMAS